MLPIKLIPVTTPNIDLSLFRTVISPEEVNEIDRKRGQPVGKFADLVVNVLSRSGDYPFKHIYQTFYFELTPSLYADITSFGQLSVTSITHGLLTKGFASGSFLDWFDFIRWTVEEDDQMLSTFATMVFSVMRNFPPFNTFQFPITNALRRQ